MSWSTGYGPGSRNRVADPGGRQRVAVAPGQVRAELGDIRRGAAVPLVSHVHDAADGHVTTPAGGVEGELDAPRGGPADEARLEVRGVRGCGSPSCCPRSSCNPVQVRARVGERDSWQSRHWRAARLSGSPCPPCCLVSLPPLLLSHQEPSQYVMTFGASSPAPFCRCRRGRSRPCRGSPRSCSAPRRRSPSPRRTCCRPHRSRRPGSRTLSH